MKLIFVALPYNKSLLAAYREHLKDLPGVEIMEGNICALGEVEAVVSHANSYGFMNGGIDAAYMKRFPGIQDRVQSEIKFHWNGELPVGCAQLVRTLDPFIPFLIAAPTMRVPANVANTCNAYLAARAALLCAKTHGIKSLAFPGLCTGTGGMDPSVSCYQIRQAVLDASHWRAFPRSIGEAWDRHQKLVKL